MNRAIKKSTNDGEISIPEVIEDSLEDAFSLTAQFSPSGVLLATGCNDGKVLVYDRTSRLYGRALFGHSGPVTCISWVSDLCLISGGADGTVCVWQNDLEAHEKSDEQRRQPSIRFCYGAPVLSVSTSHRGSQIIINCHGLAPIINDIGSEWHRVWQLPITPTGRVVEAHTAPSTADKEMPIHPTNSTSTEPKAVRIGERSADAFVSGSIAGLRTAAGTKADTKEVEGKTIDAQVVRDHTTNEGCDPHNIRTIYTQEKEISSTQEHAHESDSNAFAQTTKGGTSKLLSSDGSVHTESIANPTIQPETTWRGTGRLDSEVPEELRSQVLNQQRHLNIQDYITFDDEPQPIDSASEHESAYYRCGAHRTALTPTTEEALTYNNTAIFSSVSRHVVFVATFEGRIMKVNLRTGRVLQSASLSKAAVAVRAIQCSKDGSVLLVTGSLRSLFLLNTSTMAIIDELKEAIEPQIWHCAIISPCNQYIVSAKTPGNMPRHKLFVWEIRTAMIIKQLEGPSTEGVVSLTWHPHDPGMIASVSTAGLCYVWNESVRESWSAYTTGFKELKFNIIYTEREDEFDSEVPITKEEVMGINVATESTTQPEVKAEAEAEVQEPVKKPIKPTYWRSGRGRGKRGRGKRGAKKHALDRKTEALLAQSKDKDKDKDKVDVESVSATGDSSGEGLRTDVVEKSDGPVVATGVVTNHNGNDRSVSGDIDSAAGNNVGVRNGSSNLPPFVDVDEDDCFIVDVVTVDDLELGASTTDTDLGETDAPENPEWLRNAGVMDKHRVGTVQQNITADEANPRTTSNAQMHSALQHILPWFQHNFPYPDDSTLACEETEEAWHRDEIQHPMLGNTQYVSPHKRPGNGYVTTKPQDLAVTEVVECEHARCAQLNLKRQNDEVTGEDSEHVDGGSEKRRRCSVLNKGHRGGGNGLLLGNDVYYGWRAHRGERTLLRAYELHNR